jgi:hypothetical protein
MDSETYRTQIRQALTDAIEALDKGDIRQVPHLTRLANERYTELLRQLLLQDEDTRRMPATPHR